MEKVKDVIMYQVATDRKYKVGDKIIFDKNTTNGQYDKTLNQTAIYHNSRVYDYLSTIIKTPSKRISKTELKDISNMLENYDVIVRDLAIEEVRKEFFPDYPSRMHCMYLSENKEATFDYFKEKAVEKGKTYQIVAVKLNGKIFRVGGKVTMRRSCQSYTYYEKQAKEYWQQECPKGQAVEVLFEGTAEIVEILKEIKL